MTVAGLAAAVLAESRPPAAVLAESRPPRRDKAMTLCVPAIAAAHEKDFTLTPTLEDIVQVDAWAREQAARHAARHGRTHARRSAMEPLIHGGSSPALHLGPAW